jgi:hypothetical protein
MKAAMLQVVWDLAEVFAGDLPACGAKAKSIYACFARRVPICA